LPLATVEGPDALGHRQPRLCRQVFGDRRLLPPEEAKEWGLEGVEQDGYRPLLAGLCGFEGVGEILKWPPP
jgi:hypothetical protein